MMFKEDDLHEGLSRGSAIIRLLVMLSQLWPGQEHVQVMNYD
ncbi:unnamed protein product [Linum tenue]|uniref:Uncharacterized protein n=1 Tax=Linum tenue TaxID=586396 RepID=A0AAV0KZY0_9ROSI|nr:unnamed protein product [Linum tenue]